MTYRKLIFFAVFAAFAAGAFYPADVRTQGGAQKTYTVLAGDDLPGIAAKVRPDRATVAQTGVALVRANQKLIWERYDRAKRHVRPGTVLKVPDEASMLGMDPATAEREFSRIWRSEQHYRAGLALEGSGDKLYAFVSYVEAAKLGHGLAQARLGQLYDRDSADFVQHDLQQSMSWYQKARENQVPIARQQPREAVSRP